MLYLLHMLPFPIGSCLCSRSGLCHVVHACLREFPVGSHEILNQGGIQIDGMQKPKAVVMLDNL